MSYETEHVTRCYCGNDCRSYGPQKPPVSTQSSESQKLSTFEKNLGGIGRGPGSGNYALNSTQPELR